ncbi:S8 family serine peptidase [Ideonella azotifigens]|uniref:S8 family serine peptidase n=2 Tax=Ideonella azotifigens TaxID=513160 RepID=A0ABP3VLS8_9BURK|nr:S8 family serine peptidase [Ideonella azotifigens]MCD2342081.1 S8 family serine peptidase [Ideonella azotifigens]
MTGFRAWLHGAWLGTVLALQVGCAAPGTGEPAAAPPLVGGAPAGDGSQVIVVAVQNPMEALPTSAGSTPGLYSRKPQYATGVRAEQLMAEVAQAHRLQPLAAWPIRVLGLHCATLRVPDGVSREAVLAALAQDPRVALAQPLQQFETLAQASSPASPADLPAASATPRQMLATANAYNDPYLPLQRGVLALGVPQAHRCARGDGVRVAVIDTGVDTAHQDLGSAVPDTANFVDHDSTQFRRDRHGTEVAGLIAAQPGNGIGIVGIAPGARLTALKACWELPDGRATCNSFTLSQALAAALDGGAQVINLSLGGPPDGLLARLLRQAIARGVVVVGALPPAGSREGFPLNVHGVIAVQDATADPFGTAALAAPGREVLTLTPGGRYDFASGTSMAASHVSGIAALLLQHQPQLDGPRIEKLLREQAPSATEVNACRVLEAQSPSCHCSTAR